MDSLRGRGLLLALVAFAVLVLVVQFTGLTDRPTGFYLDESSFSWNAWSLVTTGADEHGRPWPIFFESFGDWKTAPYIYLLAAVFAITGPSILAARVLSASAGVVAVAAMGALAYRMTGRPVVAVLTAAMTLLLPWTFEPTRLALEVALMPALVGGFLLALHARPPGSSRWSIVLLAAILALLTYTYTLGRLLGPLLALGLLVYAGRDRWRAVAGTWLVYGLLLIPFLLFNLLTPDALLVRLNEAGYLGRPLPEVAGTFVAQLLGNLDPYRLLVTGDPNERHHVAEIGGSMLVGVLGFALIGIVVAIRRFTADPFLRYLVFGLVASFIPASLTLDPFHVHRLIAVPVFAIALTIPAQEWLLAGAGASGAVRKRCSPPSPSRWSCRASGSRSATTRWRATGAAGSTPITRGCWTPRWRPGPTRSTSRTASCRPMSTATGTARCAALAPSGSSTFHATRAPRPVPSS